MFCKLAALLALLFASVLMSSLLHRPSAADNDPYHAYIPLTFNNYPPPLLLRFFDDFSDPTRNWFVGSDDVVKAGHVAGEYHLGVKAGSTLVSVISPAEFGVFDYTLDADIRQVDGDDIAYGLVLDWLDWDYYAVVLVVPVQDRYALLRVSAGEAEELIPWTATDRLTDGLNHLRVERWDTYLSLAINGTVAVEAGDLGYGNDAPTRAGLAVLAVGLAETTGGFDNFLLVERPGGVETRD